MTITGGIKRPFLADQFRSRYFPVYRSPQTASTHLFGAAVTVASAATIQLPAGNMFLVSGTTNIDTILASGNAGRQAFLLFLGVLTVNDGTGNLKLAGNFTTSADDMLTLICPDGTNWYEVGRSVN